MPCIDHRVPPCGALDPSRSRIQAASLHLLPGTALDPFQGGRIWRVRSGIVHVRCARSQDTHYLAHAGDLVGLEAGVLLSPALHMEALTTAALDIVAAEGPTARDQLQAEAFAQARRQSAELMRLRSGTLASRLRHVLLSLAGPGAEACDVELPTLRQLGDIVDATPEAVCRVLGGMRKLDLLAHTRQGRTRLARGALL